MINWKTLQEVVVREADCEHCVACSKLYCKDSGCCYSRLLDAIDVLIGEEKEDQFGLIDGDGRLVNFRAAPNITVAERELAADYEGLDYRMINLTELLRQL